MVTVQDEMTNKNRQEVIGLLSSRHIHLLEEGAQGVYLFGKTGNDRAICLIWNDNNNGCINREMLHQAYREIVSAHLKVPFLFFGRSSLIQNRDLFTFIQLPWFFERQSSTLLRTLQGMNLQGNLHVPVIKEDKGHVQEL